MVLPFIMMIKIVKSDNPKWSYAHLTLGFWKYEMKREFQS